MVKESQDIQVFELLDRIESGQMDAAPGLAETVLDGVQRMVDSILARSEPRTSLSDRFSWTGSRLVDQIGAKYENEERLALSYFESQNQRALSRLAQAASPIDMVSGYSFFDFEGLVFTHAEDWDVLEEGFADELVYQQAAKRRSLFGQDIRRKATLSDSGDLGFERQLVKQPASTKSQELRRGSPVSKKRAVAKPQTRAVAQRRPTPMKPPSTASRTLVRSPYPDRMAASADMGLSPILERAIEIVEAAKTMSRAEQVGEVEFDNAVQMADSAEQAWAPSEELFTTVGPIEPSKAVLAAQEGHRIDDIRVKPHRMPALNGALNTVEGLKSRLFEAQNQSLTRALDFRPLRSPLSMQSDFDLEMSLVEPGADEISNSAQIQDTPASIPTPEMSAVSPNQQTRATSSPAPRMDKSWSIKELVRGARGPARSVTRPPARGPAVPTTALPNTLPPDRKGRIQSISQPVQVAPFEGEIVSGAQPTAVGSVLTESGSFEPPTFSLGEGADGAETVARTSMGLRPVVPLAPITVAGAQMKPGFIPVQDVFIPANAAPALAVGMAEARGAVGLGTRDISSLSKVSEARVERMMASDILGASGPEASTQSSAFDSVLASDDFAFVVPTEFDAFIEPQSSRFAVQASTPEPSLKEVAESRVGVTPQRSEKLPVEHQIIARRSLGSRLPLSLQPAVELPQDTRSTDPQVSARSVELPVQGLGQDWSARGPAPLRARAELSAWTMDGFDQLLNSPEGAALLREGVSRGTEFWQRLEERGVLREGSSEPGGLDASMIRIDSEPAEGLDQAEGAAMEDGVIAEQGLGRDRLRSVLSRAAAKSGVAANPLVPRLAKEVSARNEFSDSRLFGSSLLDVWATTPASSQPESIGRFAEALRKELQAEGIVDAALLSIPAEIAGAVQESGAERGPSGIAETPSGIAERPSGVESSSFPKSTAQVGEPESAGPTRFAPSQVASPTARGISRPRYENAARLTRQLSRMLQSLFRGGAHGMPLAGLRWENGPSTQTLDSIVDKMLATPSGQVLLSRGAEFDEASSMDIEHSDTIFLQPWLEDAFREVVSNERDVASRGQDRFDRPGVSMGMSVGRVMARQGAVSARLRALMVGGGKDTGAESSTLDEIYGWDDFSHVALGDDRERGYHDVGQSEGASVVPMPKVSPASSSDAAPVPLGLPPSGTSMDMGRLSHVMLRSSAAAPADFSLVSPVTMAVAETAQLKPKDEPIGESGTRSAVEQESSAGGEESKEIPSEIVDVLSYEIASRISYRMKFEQDRSGRWD